MPQAGATPTLHDKRADDGKSHMAAWVPAVVVVVVIILGALASVIYKYNRARPVTTATAPVHEVTAVQLAGVGASSQSNGQQANGQTATNPPTTRRPRRTRRTPSQISTKSLPAYNKEAGDQELVIYRAPDEEEEEESDDSRSALMQPVPEGDSPRPSGDVHHPDESPDHATPLLAPGLPPPQTRSSTDLQHMQDVRGPTPAYQEVVLNDDTEAQRRASDLEPTSTISRRTGSIRAFFSNLGGNNSPTQTRSPLPPVPPVPPIPAESPSAHGSRLGHARDNSGHTIASIASSGEGVRSAFPSAIRNGQRRGHRPSQSGSSVLNNLRKSIHRMGSSVSLSNSQQQNLTSPSLLSLASISAPLSHTLTRTEIEYPRGGPTPEQIRLISSRESLGRFGVPYGPDAVAYASASRASLSLPPPPDFDSIPPVPTREGAASRQSGHARTDSAGNSSEESSPDTSAEIPADVLEPAVNTASPPVPAVAVSEPVTAEPVEGLPTPSAAPPPSAFRGLPENDDRQSRRTSIASTSALSFATANESLAPSSASQAHFRIELEPPTPSASPAPSAPSNVAEDDVGSDDDANEPPTPTRATTPIIGDAADATAEPPTPTRTVTPSVRHAVEPTDATITQASPTATAAA